MSVLRRESGGRGLGWLAAALLLLLVLQPGTATAATTARPANSFVDSIGVATHLGWEGTPYAEAPAAIEQRLRELGVRHVRADLLLGNSVEYGEVTALAEAGIDSTLILGRPDEPEAVLGAMLAAVKGPLAGAVGAVEGPNEYSTSGDPDWQPHLVAYQQRLYEGVKSDPELAGLPVIGPSIVHNDQEALGDVSPWLDLGNIHSYPEAHGPEYRMGHAVEQAELNSGTKPIVATETGYTNALGWTPSGPGENAPISEQAAAVYTPRLFFEYFIRHIVRSFDFQLVDEHPNPAEDEREDHFGLLRNDLSPKPAFTALRNTIEILAEPGPPFSPGSLAFALSEGGATLHSLLLEKRDGTFYLALWRLQSVWDPATEEALDPAAEPVTVSVPGGFGSYAVYRPNSSAAPVLTSGAPADQLQVDVGPEVTILALAPPPATEPGDPTPPGAAVADPTVLPRPAGTVADGPTPRRCVVPDLKRMTVAQAARRARAAGCRLGEVRRRRGRQAAPLRVLAQHPRPGAVRAFRAQITAAVGGRPTRARRHHGHRRAG
jgi:hypothetical protein